MASNYTPIYPNLNELKIDEPKSDEARAQSNECMEIDEAKEERKEEYLSKHYIKPKEKHFQRVKFNNDHLETVRQIKTQIFETETIEKDEAILKRCTTLEEIDKHADNLLNELKNLKERKSNGYDVSYDYENLKRKLEIVRIVKERIVKEKEEKKERDEKKKILKEEEEKKRILNKINKPVEEKTKNYLPAEASKSSIKDSIADYLFKKQFAKKFDILYLFHFIDLNQHGLTGYLENKLLSINSRYRIAIGYHFKHYPYLLLRQFNDKHETGNFKHIKINNILDIRSEILNLNWENKTNKIVLNFYIKKFDFKISNFEIDLLNRNKNLDEFMNKSDDVKNLLNYKNIYFKRVEIENSSLYRRLIEKYATNEFLNVESNEIINIEYFKSLYFLKRNNFKSLDEYLMKKKDTVFSQKYKNFAFMTQNYLYANFQLLDKINERRSYYSNYDRICLICHKETIMSPTKNLFLMLGKYYLQRSDGYFWLEILENNDSLNRMIDIYELTKNYIENFSLKAKFFSLQLVSIIRILDNSDLIVGYLVDKELDQAAISFPSKIEAIECFSHYTYEKSNRSLVIIDLRTLKLDSNKFLITEPVVFTLAHDRFGSSDLGIKGIEHFKNQHECNKYCQQLNLTKLI